MADYLPIPFNPHKSNEPSYSHGPKVANDWPLERAVVDGGLYDEPLEVVASDGAL